MSEISIVGLNQILRSCSYQLIKEKDRQNGTATIYKYKRDLYPDKNFTKALILGYAPKK